MTTKAQAVQEKEWRGRDDAYTLATAEQIKADPTRMKAAATQAKKMAAEKAKELSSMSKIANSTGTPVKKRASVRKKVQG